MNRPQAGFSFVDYDNETSSVSFGIYPITAANLPGFLTDWGNLRGAVGAITLGVISYERAQVFNDKLSAAIPANQSAQRELKWLVRGYDERQFLDAANTIQNPNYQQIFTMELPCADTSKLQTNSDLADPADPDIAAFVTEIEKLWRSDSDGQIRVIDIRIVGRNI